MGTLLGILGLYGLFVILTILVQIEVTRQQVGVGMQFRNRDDMPDRTGAAFRLERGQMNSVVAMALFAPAVLILHLKGVTGGSALLTAQVFLIARVLYIVFYGFGITHLRTTAWVFGFFGTAWLYVLGLM